jgi:hypothetical protein
MKSGYPPAVIRKEDRLTYYDALDEACVSGNYDAITHLVADATSAFWKLILAYCLQRSGQSFGM